MNRRLPALRCIKVGKRSSFPRRHRDFYPTPEAAVERLLDHIEPGTTFYEPCAGDGSLTRHLEDGGLVCVGQSDIAPRGDGIDRLDAFELEDAPGEIFVTNPPWTRTDMHALIEHLASMKKPTWMLIDADWMHTKQAGRFFIGGNRHTCFQIVSVGRLKWIPGSKNTGKDNCCWYGFGAFLGGDEAAFFHRNGH